MSGGVAELPVRLVGTGPAGGLPVPGCRCRACRGPARREAAADVAGLRLGPGGVEGSVPASIEVLAAAAGVALVRAPGDEGGGLLWAPAGLPEAALPALAGAGAHVAVVGPPPGAGAAAAAAALGVLRACGATDADCDAVLVGVPHDRPAPGPVLLAAWGVREVADGTPLGPRDVPAPPRGERTLVLGGSASGKSAFAEDLLAAEPDVVYVATGPGADAADAEWAGRVAAHRDRRPARWRTLETADAAAALGAAEPVLLDAVGTWLTAVLDRSGAWDAAPGWREAVDAATGALVAAWRARAGLLVAVSDEVGGGVVPATAAGRLFRTELGRLNERLAAESEHVYLVTAGRPVPL